MTETAAKAAHALRVEIAELVRRIARLPEIMKSLFSVRSKNCFPRQRRAARLALPGDRRPKPV
jgi:hypothetical protein